MSEETKIQWATSTGNPWIGCTKVSPGCKNCYAATLDANRFSRTMGGGTKEHPVSHWGKGAPRFRTKGFWKDAVRWNKDAEKRRVLELHSVGAGVVHNFDRPRIFPSLCDWLDDEVPIEWLADFLKLIHDTPNLDWLLLTKRLENWESRIGEATEYSHGETWQSLWTQGEAPENVWIGTSVEDQQRANERIPKLLNIPAKVRFLSVEPLLAAIDLGLRERNNKEGGTIDLVIVGGESGPGARPCNVEWIRSIVQQCKAADVAVFCKQLGSVWAKENQANHSKGGDPSEWPEDLRVREFPTIK